MEYKDYYQTLGVPKTASREEIKKAFHRLARQYHPDMNPDDPNAEARFKEINEAYEVLGDPEKRAKYDQLGTSYREWQQAGDRSGGFDWSEWFAAAPGGVRVEFSDADTVFSEFFRAIFGGGFGQPVDFDELLGGRGSRRSHLRHRRDAEAEVQITLSEAYHGTTRTLSVDGRRLQVRIPRGAHTGTHIRLSGEGRVGIGGGQAGDIYLRIAVSEHPRFERKGDDLHTSVTVDLFTAVLGGEVRVPTLGGDVTLKIKPGTQPGQRYRLQGKGMPNLNNPDQYGDLFARINVEIPKDLSAREREIFEQLAEFRSHNH